mgnify:CR=1 FL=1
MAIGQVGGSIPPARIDNLDPSAVGSAPEAHSPLVETGAISSNGKSEISRLRFTPLEMASFVKISLK